MIPIVSFADTINCSYKNDVTSVIESKITGTRKVKIQVTPYLDRTRRCFIDMEVQVSGKWLASSGFKVFDPDMSESKACELAKLRAKTRTLEELGIEIFKASKDKQCVEKSTQSLAFSQPCMRAYRNVIVQGRPLRVWHKLCNVNGTWVKR